VRTFRRQGCSSVSRDAGKVRAAVDTRRDGDFQIVGRTDARAVQGLDAALDRAQAMIAAGADATFVEAPTSRDEIRRVLRELLAPQIVNMVFGGRTPEMPRSDLAAMGAGIPSTPTLRCRRPSKAPRRCWVC
jgi:2-methylisocitrate lyase-like PEP mutase family enzyme